MATYNGHKNWAHWNVSLWIGNNEGLYQLARRYIRLTTNREDAARNFVACLSCQNITHTPDGARYTKTAVRAAMVGM